MASTPADRASSKTPAEVVVPPTVPLPQSDRSSYGEILKSSAVMGGSAMINVAVGVIRTKAMALLLGPAGIGLMGLFVSILNLAQTLAAMGINTSGVRQIADAVGSGNSEQVALTTVVLRRTALVLGLLGAVLLALFARPISILTFNNGDQSGAIAMLALAVFLGAVSAGQAALIQGMRRIGDLARMGVIGGVAGTILSLLLIYLFREQGIVPALVAVAAVTVFVSWWFTRKIHLSPRPVGEPEWKGEVFRLLKLGLAFNASAVLTMAAAYLIRLIVLRKVSFEAAGLYQSAWAIGGLYAGFILQAMVTDFYPRLTAVAGNNRECNRLVNEQAEISLLLAGPGVIATMTFAPLILALFYTSQFAAAAEPLRWISVGMALRVIAWPVGFIVLAKGIQKIFFWTEVAATIVHVGLAFLLVNVFGLKGAAMAFVGLYLWHVTLMYLIGRRLTGFRWSVLSRRCIFIFVPIVTLVFALFYCLPFWIATAVGTVAVIGTGIYSIRLLTRLVPIERSPRLIRQLLCALRIVPNGAV